MLDKLTPDDWRALAALPDGASEIATKDRAQWLRLYQSGVIADGGKGRNLLTAFGHGVIAAARVLVPRAFADVVAERMRASPDAMVRLAAPCPDLTSRDAIAALTAEAQRQRARTEVHEGAAD